MSRSLKKKFNLSDALVQFALQNGFSDEDITTLIYRTFGRSTPFEKMTTYELREPSGSEAAEVGAGLPALIFVRSKPPTTHWILHILNGTSNSVPCRYLQITSVTKRKANIQDTGGTDPIRYLGERFDQRQEVAPVDDSDS